jgi:uncharacterized protein YbjQ (UPF0145 family)
VTSPAEAALRALSAAQRKGDDHPGGRAVSGAATEVIFLDRNGWEPLGLVSGAAVFHVGVVGWPRGNVEVGQLSEAMYGAREKALAGLTTQAQRLEATGVANVTVDVHFMEEDRHLPRFVATGTAVRSRVSGSVGTGGQTPFVTTMTAAELGMLHNAGFRPLGIVMGSCVYHVGRQSLATWAGNLTRNRELTGYSSGFYDARELAMTRLQNEALALSADGVVGVTTEERSHVWGSRVIEFFAIGNAIAATDERAAQTPPTLVVALNDPSSRTDPAAIIEERTANHGRGDLPAPTGSDQQT